MTGREFFGMFSYWPWIIAATFSLTSLWILVRRNHSSGLRIPVGGASLLAVVMGVIELVDTGHMTGSGIFTILSTLCGLLFFGAIAGFAGIFIGALLESFMEFLKGRRDAA